MKNKHTLEKTIQVVILGLFFGGAFIALHWVEGRFSLQFIGGF